MINEKKHLLEILQQLNNQLKGHNCNDIEYDVNAISTAVYGILEYLIEKEK